MSTRRTINGALLGVPEAAAFLGLSQRSLRWHADHKRIPFRRLAGRLVFRRSELEAFIDRLPGVSLHEARQYASKKKPAAPGR